MDLYDNKKWRFDTVTLMASEKTLPSFFIIKLIIKSLKGPSVILLMLESCKWPTWTNKPGHDKRQASLAYLLYHRS